MEKPMVVTEDDCSTLRSLIKGLTDQVSGMSKSIHDLLKRVEDAEVSTAKGVSFLEVKYHLLLSYLIDLSYVILRKTKGQPVGGNPAVMRLAENRTVLEKMRPIDQKLHYQIDKLIKTAATGVPAENDPLRFKPNPDNLVSKLQDEEGDSDDDDDEEGEKSEKPKKYVPPKVAAMYYDGDETTKERQERQLEKAKKRALSSSLIRELRAEYHEGPEEITESQGIHRLKEDKEAKHKQEYEEDNFVRLPVTKKDKQASRRMTTMSSLDALTRFDDISVLDRGVGEGSSPAKKRRKLSSKIRKIKQKQTLKRKKRRF